MASALSGDVMERREGIDVFMEFLRSINASEGESARALGITRGLISHWKRKGQRPGAAIRAAIAKWSRGRVPEACWLLPEEIVQLDRVQPVAIARVRKAAQARAALPVPETCAEGEVDLCLAATGS